MSEEGALLLWFEVTRLVESTLHYRLGVIHIPGLMISLSSTVIMNNAH